MYEDKELNPKKTKKEKEKKVGSTHKFFENKSEKDENQQKKRLIFKADWISIGVKLGLLLAFSFLIIFVMSRIKPKSEEEVFAKNIETMKAAASTYFKKEEHRPTEEHEGVELTLQEMIDADVIDELKDHEKKTCNADDSYVGLVKQDDTTYTLDVYLACGEEVKAADYTLVYKDSKKKNESSSLPEEQETVHLLYEQKRTLKTEEQYSCPDGYTLSGKDCYSKAQTLSTPAIAKYKVTPAKETSARYAKGKTSYEYVDAIATKEKDTLTCASGYSLVNGKCQREIAATKQVNTVYSCPNGGTLSGTKCLQTVSGAQTKTQYSCAKGTLVNGNKCMVTTSLSTRCKYGKYDSNKKQCYVLVDAQKTWTKWSYVGKIKTTKKVSNTAKVQYLPVTGTKNTYKKYTRKQYYKCLIGTYYKNGKCKDYDDLYKETYCKSGYKLSKNEKQCYKYVAAKATKVTEIKCPSGYSKYNNECRKYVNATKSNTVSYKCATGYTLAQDKCVKTIDATLKTGKVTYSCPEGYSIKGSGSKTQCYKTTTSSGYYYCSNSNATLEGTRCYTPEKKEFVRYECPSSYKLSGATCYKVTDSKRISATKVQDAETKVETKWTEEKELDGWSWTGKTKEV